MLIARAQVPTQAASRYLQQLCKHFGHRVPATFDPAQGRIEFAMGLCTLRAGEGALSLQAEAGDADDLRRLEEVVGSHLERFAFREGLRVDWTPAAG